MSDSQAKVAEKREASFRQDLVGLRGVAVLAVLLHHFEIPGFVGAFYGPDIFFVLSGFLITGSLVREYGRNLERTGKGSISFIGLYLRRARRIVPAATFVIIAINLYSYFFVNELRRHSIYVDSIWTFFFGANIRFLKEATDYFSTDGISPLVHFWSLSVTEQFYVFWPLLLLLAAKLPIPNLSGKSDAWKKQMIVVLTALIATSFVWSLTVFDQSANRAYFSTFCRAWELAIGGAIAILTFREVHGPSRKAVAVARNIGLLLLFGSVLIVTPDNFGYTIFIPVLACSFIIFTGKYFPADLSSKTLGSLPLRSLGTISYSVYLWHWPVFVFAHNLGWMDSILNKFLGIVVTLILGTATYFLVEQTFMRIPIPKDSKFANENLTSRQLIQKRVICGIAIGLVMILPFNVFIKPKLEYRFGKREPVKVNSQPINNRFYSGYGVESAVVPPNLWSQEVASSTKITSIPDDLDSPLSMLADPMQYRGHGFGCMDISKSSAEACAKGSKQSNQDPNAPKVVILGSSFAEALVPATAAAFDPKNYNLRGYTMGMCSIADVRNLKKDGSDFPECSVYRAWYIKEIVKLRPAVIVMSTYAWRMRDRQDTFTAKFVKSLMELKKSGAKLVVVGSMPVTGQVAFCMTSKTRLGPDCFTNPNSRQNRRDEEKAATIIAGGIYIDPRPWICTKNVCPPIINNQIVSWDGFHLTTWMSKNVGRLLRSELVKRGVIAKQ